MQTPVGYRCVNCVRGQQAVFDTAQTLDLILAAGIGALGVGIATFLLGFLGIWGLLLAPVLGAMLAGIIRVVVRRRRSRNLPRTAGLGGIVGILVNVGLGFLKILPSLSQSLVPDLAMHLVLLILWPLAHGTLVVVILYFRLREN
jgi:hypothetical protein